MKKNIITLTIIAIFATTAFSAQVDKPQWNRISSEEMASNLIQEFDTDNSTALNQLELSGAITYLRYTRPITNRGQNANAVSSDLPHPPKIAVDLVDNFDTDSDIQLTEEELSEAIAYLRELNQNNRYSVADAS